MIQPRATVSGRPPGRAEWVSAAAARALVLLACLAALPAGAAAQVDSAGAGSLAATMGQANPNGAACLLDIRRGVVLAAHGPEFLGGAGLPVGSLMKVFTAYALVAAGADASEVHYCPPSSPEQPATETCWYRPGHGNMSLRSALANSCNSYFRAWLAGRDPGPALALLDKLGLHTGEPPGRPRRALLGFDPAVRPRPIALAWAAASLFNGGTLYASSSVSTGRAQPPIRGIRTDGAALRAVAEGMRECALSGTGSRVQRAAGATRILVKTGTAPHWADGRADYGATDGWCLVLFPADRPRYLLLVFSPGTTGGEGAAAAAAEFMSRLRKDER